MIDNSKDIQSKDGQTLAEIAVFSEQNKKSFFKQHACAVQAYNLQAYEDAVKYASRAVNLYPLHLESREIFLYGYYLSSSRPIDEDIRTAFIKILKNPNGLNVNLIERCWVHFVKQDEVLGKVISETHRLGFEDFTAYLNNNDQKIFEKLQNQIFFGGLNFQFVPDVEIGKFIQNIRRFILSALISGKLSGNQKDVKFDDIALSIAHASFSSDYIWEVSDQEVKDVSILKEQIVSGARQADVTNIAIIASYCKLLQEALLHPTLDSFLFKFKNKKLKGLLTEQLYEPRKERQLRINIKSFGAISDQVSLAVREQYEENPYPRWTHQKPLHVDELADRLNLYWQGSGNILIAGSATGEYSINISKKNPRLSVTGIDLSLASIGYSERKKLQVKVNNLSFYHGDLLNIRDLGKVFDVIESVGVIHHMDNPMKGLENLLSVLQPGGYLKLGIYSKLARKSITECQAEIKAMGLDSDYAGIRSARKMIIEKPEGHAYHKMYEYSDFYNSSMLRDLLFHVQEHCYEISDIKHFLEKFDLEFLGFSEIDTGQSKLLYKQKFPDDVDMVNLDNWAIFENEYPDTFIRMYKFWCQKRI